MCYPAMLALVTCPEVDLPRLETLTRAVHQCAANGLQKHVKQDRRNLRQSQPWYEGEADTAHVLLTRSERRNKKG